MHILLVTIGYRGYGPLYSDALAALGHEVTTFVGLRQRHLPTRLRRVVRVRIPAALGIERDYLWSEQSRLRSFLRWNKARYDLVLFANSSQLADDAMLAEVSERGMRSALWMLDDVDTVKTSGLDLRSFEYLASFNGIECAELNRMWGRQVLFVPQGFASIPFVPSGEVTSRILLIGAPYPSRRAAVRSLLSAGLDVDLVGSTWSSYEREDRHLRMSADVSLSDSLSMSAGGRTCVNGHRSPTTGVSPRVFEIGGAGGLIVSDNVNAPEFFEPGVEMLHWSEPDQAADHALRARQDARFAASIALRGHRRTLAEHTLDKRFAALLAGWGFS